MDEYDFEIDTPWGPINFSDLDANDWAQIKKLCRQIINKKIVNEVSVAYVLAFHYFVKDKIAFLQPFDPKRDTLN